MIEDNKEIFLLDTNVLVYAYDESDKEKHAIASKLIERCWKGEVRYAVSMQNLSEFSNIITKKVRNPLDEESTKRIILDMINFYGFMIISYGKKTIISALDIKKNDKTSFWDALLIATMLENNVFNIYSENEKDFIKVKNISIINPFK